MIKINSLMLENVKRIKAVKLTPEENGLTIIGGGNGEGKTSVLDAIVWALGGDKYRPSNAKRDKAYSEPYIRIELSNGIVVERQGKNSSLKVTCPDGTKSGQTLLDGLIEELALNLPKFMQASGKEKAKTLLKIIGAYDALSEYDRKEAYLYNERCAVGRMAEQKKKYAAELPHYEGVPETPVSASDLLKKHQEILLHNAENKKKRDEVEKLRTKEEALKAKIRELTNELSQVITDLGYASLSAKNLNDISTSELEANIENIDALNIKIRANLERERAFGEAEILSAQYDDFTEKIETVRKERMQLLENSELPLPGLSVENGELTYFGRNWDCLSSAEQLKVATAIVGKIKPECGFVLLDKLEQMDIHTLREFGEWLEERGMQAIATRVSDGSECSVIISDGTIIQDGGDFVPEFTEGRF